MNKCDTINDNMMAYRDAYNDLEGTFDRCEVKHVIRNSNDEADVLANIGLQCLPVPPGVFWEEIIERSVKPKKLAKSKKKGQDASPKVVPESSTSDDEEDQEEVLMIQT